MSLIQTPWTSQPQQFVRNSGTDLMRGAYIWTPHNPRQLVGPRVVQATAETAYNNSPVGDKGVARKWSRSANAGVDFGTTQIITQNSGVTVLVVANPTSAATMKVPFSQRLASGAFTQTDFLFNSDGLDSLGATAGSVTLTTYHAASGGVRATSQIDGQTHCWVAGNGTANGYIFRDGVKQTLANSMRTSTFTVSTQKLRIGNIGDDASTTYPCDDPVYLVVVWDRLLSETEARSVSENPWQVFQPIPRRIFVPVSAGGGTTTVTADHAASYTITGSVAADASAAYAIRSAVTADAAASYVLRTAAQADRPAAYAIRAAVASDLASSYAIQSAGTVSTGLDATYAVRGAVSSDISVGYQIAAAVQAEVTAAYAVRSAVQKDLTASYAIQAGLGAVAADMIAAYVIDGSTTTRAPSGAGPSIILPGSTRPGSLQTSGRPPNLGGRRH